MHISFSNASIDIDYVCLFVFWYVFFSDITYSNWYLRRDHRAHVNETNKQTLKNYLNVRVYMYTSMDKIMFSWVIILYVCAFAELPSLSFPLSPFSDLSDLSDAFFFFQMPGGLSFVWAFCYLFSLSLWDFFFFFFILYTCVFCVMCECVRTVYPDGHPRWSMVGV